MPPLPPLPRHRLRAALFLVGLVSLLPVGPTALAKEGASTAVGRIPRKNFSYVHADIEWIRGAFQAAKRAATENDWIRVVQSLQPVIENQDNRERGGGRSPYVRAVEGEATYEGAHIAAAHAIVAFGDEAIAAYEAEFGGLAKQQLARAARRRDPDLLMQVATRYLASRAGRNAALLLVDLALERGDRDTAHEWLEALEDLEDVSAAPAEQVAPLRRARIARHAALLAPTPSAAKSLRALLAARPAGTPSLDAIPYAMRRAAPELRTWPTTGGTAARNGVPPSVGSALTWQWSVSQLADSTDPVGGGRAPTTSPWHPPRAVTTAEHAFVSDGNQIHVLKLDDGRVATLHEFAEAADVSRDTDEDPRLKFGLLEGHALSIVPLDEIRRGTGMRRTPGWIVYAAVPDGGPWAIERKPEDRKAPRKDRIQAFIWDGTALHFLWSAGGAVADRGLRADTRLYGAPIFYRGKLWVAGIRPEESSGDRWQAWLFALDPLSGELQHETHLGTGAPVRRGRFDEVIPTSPSAAHGRVVVGTSIGIISAVSARDGRIAWAYRYDRETDPERERRNTQRPSAGLRVTGFSNNPPILALDRCVVSPVDGTSVLVLASRPRGRARTMRCQELAREGAVVDMSIEQIAGLVPGSGSLVLVGRGQDTEPAGPIVAARDTYSAARRFEHPGPTMLALEPYGNALVTAREIFVPTRAGIAIYDLDKGGADLGVLEVGMLPKDLRADFPAPYGNLIPVPGRGVLALTATTITFWARTK